MNHELAELYGEPIIMTVAKAGTIRWLGQFGIHILAGNLEIRHTRKFEIRDILWPFSVPIDRVSRELLVFSNVLIKPAIGSN